MAVPSAPTVTIFAAATGAMLRSPSSGTALLDLGRVSYFKGTTAPGLTNQKKTKSFVITTRFGLKVDCPGSAASARVNVTMTRTDEAPSHSIAIDGAALQSAPRTLSPAMPCGSGTEHRLDVEVPTSTPPGSIGSSVVFLATLNR